MNEIRKQRQVIKISVFITSVFIMFISISYAFLSQALTGTKKQVITVGNLELELKEGELITLNNALPMYDEVGMIQKEFAFTLTNKSTQDTNYTLKLKDVTGEDKQKLDTTLVRYGFIKDGVVTKDSLSNLENNVLDSGKITGSQAINYSLRLWIDSSVEDEVQIKDRFLSYQIEVEAEQDIQENPNSVEAKLFAHDNLGTNCKTYDDGVDTFLVGQCNQNYIWYSGKIWRVVLKNNETGAVKMVTDNAITTIYYNSSGNSAFENSYADQWLNQEFLPTLHDSEKYLVLDSVWNVTTDDSEIPLRPAETTIVKRTVGLLNVYEYYTTYTNSDGMATIKTGYLNNGIYWWLITPYDSSSLRRVIDDGSLGNVSPSLGAGIRPTVYLKPDIQVVSGTGTIDNPYWLEGDKQDVVTGATLLSTRYSGEYISFNNALYRIIGTEARDQETFTKVMAVEKPTELREKQFHSIAGITDFREASIKTDLETYYQNNIDDPYKSMIVENQVWYLGTLEAINSYKASVCANVDDTISTYDCVKTDIYAVANIGLPRVGEMFTGQMNRRIKENFFYIDSKFYF